MMMNAMASTYPIRERRNPKLLTSLQLMKTSSSFMSSARGGGNIENPPATGYPLEFLFCETNKFRWVMFLKELEGGGKRKFFFYPLPPPFTHTHTQKGGGGFSAV